MKLIGAAILLAGVVLAQHGGAGHGSSSPVPNAVDLPNAAERALISGEHYRKNVEQSDRLLRLAMDLKTDPDRQTGLVVSAKTARDAEEIRKLADSIAKRLKSD
jgi:hypothetical protein